MRPPPVEALDGGVPRPARVLIEYVGETGLTARGPRTGHTYRFRGEGAVVAVDVRDARSLERVPKLRRLR